jgi:fibronectin type 3 domain-containing protein
MMPVPEHGSIDVRRAVLPLFMLAILPSCGRMPEASYLSAPQLLDASDGTFASNVLLRWSSVGGALKYAVYRSDSFDGPYARIASPSASSYEDTDIVVQKTYFYKVASIDRDHAEGRSCQTDSGYADTVVHVVRLSASDGASQDGVSLAWSTEGPGEASYRVFRSDTADGSYLLIAEPTMTSYLDTSAEQGLPYFYQIQALSPLGDESPLSNRDSGYASLASTVITVSKGESSAGIDISWKAVAHAQTYQVCRSQSSSGPFQILSTVSGVTFRDSSSDVVGVNLSRDFFYKVTAVSAYGVTGPDSNVDVGYASEGSPAGLSASDGTLYGVRLNWHAVASASMYNVYRLRGSSYALCGSVTEPVFYDDAVSSEVDYFYKVSAVCNGHETPLSAEVRGRAKSPTESVRLKISWKANRQKGVNRSGGGYRIHYSRNRSFLFELTQDVPFVSGEHAPNSGVIAFNPDQKGIWYVRVSAYSNIAGGKESPESSLITVTVE